MNKRDTGRSFEEAAAKYLGSHGYEIISRNYRCRQGEVDLVCRHGKYLVFAEVKYRSSPVMGSPAEAVDHRKQEHIRSVAAFYLYSHRLPEDTPCRFDVVSILGEQMEVIQNAF